MKNFQNKSIVPTRKWVFKSVLMAFALVSATSVKVAAQNSSYDLNTIPIGGGNSCGFGWQSLMVNAGNDNSGFGYQSLLNNTTGISNTGIGFQSMLTNTTGLANTGLGFQSLFSNTIGEHNTGLGYRSLYLNTTGFENVSVGQHANYHNTTGFQNTGVGSAALHWNTTAIYNTAVGVASLYNNTADGNTGTGAHSLWANTTGLHNSAFGIASLTANTIGKYNSAAGAYSLNQNTTGNENAALGYYAGTTNTTGYKITTLGANSDVSVNNLFNATALGDGAIVNANNKVRFGNAAVAVVEGPVAYTVSDGRFKTKVNEADVKGLDFILKLRPVVYNFETRQFQEFLTKNMSEKAKQAHLNEDFTHSTAIRQSGFIAQEVEAAAKEANYDFNGVHKPDNDNDNYSLAYGQFVVPLVKAVQEQQAMIEKQQQQIEQLQKLLAASLTPATGVQGKSGVTGMEENRNTSDQIKLYPNPASETITLENISGTFDIRDITGKLLLIGTVESGTPIHVNTLSTGMYIIRVKGYNGKVFSQNFSKE